MRLRIGAVLVSIWSGVNLLLAVGDPCCPPRSRDPPSLTLYVPPEVRASLTHEVVGLVKALAVLFNACAAAFCGLVLVVTWKAVVRRVRWAWGAVAAATLLIQAAGFASDAYLANQNVVANAGSSALLLAGLGLCFARHGPEVPG